jgi:3-oxoacyl-[acyl-carrier-protein] synthase-3
MTSRPVYLSDIGQALGPRILTNAELSAVTGLEEEDIRDLTGITTRSFSPFEDETDLAVRAAEDLFSRMGGRTRPDMLLLATTTPSGPVPQTAAKVQGRLFSHSTSGPSAMDIGGSCAAFLTGLFVANAHIASGAAEDILLVNTERKTRHVCPEHSPETALLFGDGATAVWLSSKRMKDGTGPFPLRIRSVQIGADGGQARRITYSKDPDSGRKILRMEGPALFRSAVRTLSREIKRHLAQHSLSADRVAAFILHQANERILEGVAQRIGVPSHRLPRTIDVHGNTSSASLGITLAHFLSQNGPRPLSGPLLLAAIGGGITWGTALLSDL